MTYRVSRLCSVICTHAYFTGVQVEFLRWEPDPSMTGTLAGQRLLFRSVPNGFELYYEVDTTQSDTDNPPALSIDPDLALRFIARAGRGSLVSATDPLPSPSEPFYVGNANGLLVGDTGRLHADETVSETDRVRLVRERTFLRYPSVETEVELRVVGLSGAVLFQETVGVEEGFVEANVDLSHQGPGPFEVFLDGDLEERIFVDPVLLADPPTAIAELVMAPSGTGFPILDPSGDPVVGGRVLAIHFAARAATWRYVVVPRSDPALEEEDLAIEDTGPDGYEFDSEPKGPLGSGVEAVVFESTSAIPFRAVPYRGLTLRSRVGDNPDLVTMIADLPNPRPDALALTSTDARPVSEIYVYL